MTKPIDPIREAKRALRRVNQAQKIFHALPESVQQQVILYAYAVECAKSRLMYLLEHYEGGRHEPTAS